MRIMSLIDPFSDNKFLEGQVKDFAEDILDLELKIVFAENTRQNTRNLQYIELLVAGREASQKIRAIGPDTAADAWQISRGSATFAAHPRQYQGHWP